MQGKPWGWTNRTIQPATINIQIDGHEKLTGPLVLEDLEVAMQDSGECWSGMLEELEPVTSMTRV
jgi:hypothetical protein